MAASSAATQSATSFTPTLPGRLCTLSSPKPVEPRKLTVITVYPEPAISAIGRKYIAGYWLRHATTQHVEYHVPGSPDQDYHLLGGRAGTCGDGLHVHLASMMLEPGTES